MHPTTFFPKESQRIHFRLFTVDDITDRYIDWLNDCNIVKYSRHRFKNLTRKSAIDYLETFKGTNNLFLALDKKSSGHTIGTITAYWTPDTQSYDLGILIGERYLWNQGYGSEAWKCVMDCLIKEKCVKKVTGGTHENNKGMRSIMEKYGMRRIPMRKNEPGTIQSRYVYYSTS